MKFRVPAPACLLACLAASALAADWQPRKLSELAVYPEQRVPAVVAALDEARLAAEVAGRIEALPARPAQALARGAVMARLDDRTYRIEVERARAQLALIENRIRLAESQLAQAESLAGGSFLSDEALRIRRTELEVQKSERDAARQALAAAQLALERTVIRAPFDGVVRERLASVGELAAPGTPLLSLAASGPAELRAQVPLAQIDGLRAARERRLIAGGRSVAVEVLRVSPLVGQAGQTREVVLAAREALAPGLAGELRWASPRPHLPPEYVQRRKEQLGAFVVERGQPVFRVLPQAEAGRPVPVDWPPGTAVVDAGRFALGGEEGAGR